MWDWITWIRYFCRPESSRLLTILCGETGEIFTTFVQTLSSFYKCITLCAGWHLASCLRGRAYGSRTDSSVSLLPPPTPRSSSHSSCHFCSHRCKMVSGCCRWITSALAQPRASPWFLVIRRCTNVCWIETLVTSRHRNHHLDEAGCPVNAWDLLVSDSLALGFQKCTLSPASMWVQRFWTQVYANNSAHWASSPTQIIELLKMEENPNGFRMCFWWQNARYVSMCGQGRC